MHPHLKDLIDERDLLAYDPSNAAQVEALDEQIESFLKAGDTHFDEQGEQQ